jgi:exopolyphosphatase/guanosine-5'-triphosphate,3'-diphosphate pyrophosphatase
VRVGAIDIGTNSVLLLVAELEGQRISPIVERATITRLGEDVDRTRALKPAAAERTLACLRAYGSELAALGVQLRRAVGTSALRDAAGGESFLDAAELILGIRPVIISGDEEASLTFVGALSGLTTQGSVAVFDVGGGSTEIIVGSAEPTFGIEAATSLDIGSVRLFERHVRHDPPTAEEMAAVARDIELALVQAPAVAASGTLVGVAGTVTTLAAISLGLSTYDSARVHGHVLTREQVFEVAGRLGALNLQARQQLAGLEPKRADVIVVGAELVRQILLWSGAPDLVVSDRGVRWGLVTQQLPQP